MSQFSLGIIVFSSLAFFSGCESSHQGNHIHTHPNQHKGMHHDFSDAKTWSKKFDDPSRDSWQKPSEIMKAMNLKEGETVADIGAGTGYLLSHLSAAVGDKGKVYALDIEQSLIDFMNQRAKKEKLTNVTAELIPMDSPGKRMAEADKVVVLNTWHHISNRDQYAKELFHNLKPSASIIVVEPEKGAGGPGPGDHHRTHYPETAKDFTAVGFKCRQAKENLGHQYIAICQK